MGTEQYLTLNEAAIATPGRPHVSAVWRWARKGVKVRHSPERVRLQCVRAGARLLTKQVWLDEFMGKLAQADLMYFEAAAAVPVDPPPPHGTRTEAQRTAAAEAARKRIAR
jgi:hypothetical protein